jgi:hypothetical protein
MMPEAFVVAVGEKKVLESQNGAYKFEREVSGQYRIYRQKLAGARGPDPEARGSGLCQGIGLGQKRLGLGW